MATPVNSPVTPWFTTAAVTSDEMRYALQALGGTSSAAGIGSEIGVFPSLNAAAVAAASATSVTVQPFQAVVQHATGASYIVTFPSAVTVPVDANASNSRYDRVIVEVLDSEVTSGDGAKVARIRVVNGTAAASPTEPSIPATAVELARLTVTSAAITVLPRIPYTRARGGMRLTTSSDTRGGSYPGDTRIWADGRIDVWTGSAWMTSTAPAAWTEQPATFTFDGAGSVAAGTVNAGSGGSVTVRYKRAGNDLKLNYYLLCGTSGVGGGAGRIKTSLPAGMTSGPRPAWIPCHLYTPGASGVRVATEVNGAAWIPPNSNEVIPYFPITLGESNMAPMQNASSAATSNTGVPLIPSAFPLINGSILVIGPAEIEVA